MANNKHTPFHLIIALAILIFILLSSSCTRKIYRSFEKNHLNTTTIIDTLVRTVPDSTTLLAFFKCDSNNRVVLSQIQHLQSKNASNQLLIDSLGKVEIKTRWRTQVIERERIVRDTTTIYKTISTEKHTPYIPSFVWWIILALSTFCAILLWLFLRKR